MNQCFKIFTAIIIVFSLLLSTPHLTSAVSDTTDINLNVTAVCNNNGICEPDSGEDSNNCPSDCPSQMVGGSIPLIYNVSIDKITLNSAEISWETTKPALCQLFWGETQDYEKGVISEIAFYLKHATSLINLLSGTSYHFKIECRDTNGIATETTDQKFTTFVSIDITPPANVINFEAISGDSQITLKWKNPPDADFKGVRIMRSEEFYPSDPWEGTLVYAGRGTSFVDTNLTNGKRYYYTAFAYDQAGNYASGTTASAVPSKVKPVLPPEQISTEKECLEAGFYWYDEACHREPKIVPAPPEVEKIKLEDFDFLQEGQKITLIEESKIKTETEKPLTTSIDYEKVPEVLKTIMVTLEKDDKFFSFLLRINQEKTAYLATLMPPAEPGTYPLTINILDYKNQVMKKIAGELIVSEVKPSAAPWYKKFSWLWILLIFLISGPIIYLIRKKLKKKKEKEKITPPSL